MSWKTDVALKLKCYQNWNFTLTEMLQNPKISSKWNLNQNKSEEIVTDHLGLVVVFFICDIKKTHIYTHILFAGGASKGLLYQSDWKGGVAICLTKKKYILYLNFIRELLVVELIK